MVKGINWSPIKAEQTNGAYLCPALKTTKGPNFGQKFQSAVVVNRADGSLCPLDRPDGPELGRFPQQQSNLGSPWNGPLSPGSLSQEHQHLDKTQRRHLSAHAAITSPLLRTAYSQSTSHGTPATWAVPQEWFRCQRAWGHPLHFPSFRSQRALAGFLYERNAALNKQTKSYFILKY